MEELHSTKILEAFKFSNEHRSLVNDVFYFATLKHIDHTYIEKGRIPDEIVVEIKKTWTNCLSSLLGDSRGICEKGELHLIEWRSILGEVFFH